MTRSSELRRTTLLQGTLVFALLVALSGCDRLPSFGGPAAEPDTVAIPLAPIDVPPPTILVDAGGVDSLADAGDGPPTPLEEPRPAVDSATVAVGPQSLEDRLDQLIAGQQRLEERFDSLAAAGAGGVLGAAGTTPTGNVGVGAVQDSAGTVSGTEIIGEARTRVQNLGVGVFWSILVLLLTSLTVRGSVWLLDTLAESNASRRLFYKRLVPIVRILLWAFAVYFIVSVIFRIQPQQLFAAAAAIGVAIGFAAQDLLKNLFGGIILVFDQPFQVGDKINVAGTYGEVVSIGLRSTRIVTPDDNLVSVPNAQVVDQQVANANAGELNCQVVTDLYLPGWADEATAKKIAFEAAASSKYVYLNKPIVTLVADVFKETFLTRVRVKAYVLDPRLEFAFQSDVTERAREGFRNAGLLEAEHIEAHFFDHVAAGVLRRTGGEAPTVVTPGSSGDGDGAANNDANGGRGDGV